MRIKQDPEDFIVEEIAQHPLDGGGYALCTFTKRGMTGEEALARIARELGVERKDLAVAGTKDKHAITTQYLTVRGNARSFDKDGLALTLLGRVREPLGLGMLEGNRFTITVRDLREERFVSLTQVPNYFDEQRFSSDNVMIGRLIITKRYAEAARLVATTVSRVRDALAARPHDAVTALRELPKHTLLMYVHAYQSALFNEALSRYILAHDPHAIRIEGPVPILLPSRAIPAIELPLIGFASELDAPYDGWYAQMLDREGISQRDFVNRQIPFLTLAGTMRPAFVDVQELAVTQRTSDETGGEMQTLTFALSKGSYATIVLKCCYRSGTFE